MLPENRDEDLPRAAALRDAHSILLARERAERELAQSLAVLRGTLESTTDAIVVTDGHGRIIEHNQRYQALWRVPAELIAAGDHRRVLEATARQFDDAPAFLVGVEGIYATAPAETHDLLELTDGRAIERHSRILYVADQGVGRVWTFRDVTERRRADETRARLAAIVESSEDAIVSKTLDGIIATWNDGARRMFGYRAEEVVGKPVTVLLPADRHDEEREILARLVRGERIEQFETIRVCKDGTLRPVSLTISPIRDARGVVIGAAKIARDLTQRVEVEQALREETRVLELLNQTGTAIAAQLDLDNLLQLVTDSATALSGGKYGAFFLHVDGSFRLSALTGAPREEIDWLGMPWGTPLFEATLRGVGVVRSSDVTRDPRSGGKAAGGPQQARSYLAVPIVARSGEVIGGLFFGHPDAGVFTERSERLVLAVAAQAAVAIDNAHLYDDVRRLAGEREQLLEAERAARQEAERVSLLKDEFLANLSHELRTPLNAILGWSQLIVAGAAQGVDQRRGLETIARNARAQARLIEDLLDMSRIVSGKLRLEVKQVDLALVAQGAVDTVRPSAEAKEIRLEQSVDPAIGPAAGDPNRLQQVVWNLLSNAVKFTPRGGTVFVTLSREPSHVEIAVRDTGQGIRPDFLPHVFERFRQADPSTTRKQGGLGLGLSIVKHLVELHGGTVEARSPGEGQGATFVVRLPVAAVRGDAEHRELLLPRTRLRECELIDLTGVRVLLVDDEPDARELLRRVLARCRAKVLTAASAAEALEIVRRERPDVLVSDIGMPDMDGHRLVRAMRKLPPDAGGRTPAVALTAYARSEDRTRAILAGYQVHVAKPVEPYELVATVASLAGRMPGASGRSAADEG
jgi:PAS domain S-box-containing protein